MKTKSSFLIINKVSALAMLATAAMCLFSPKARATNYAGNGDGSFGGPLGHGILSVTDDGTNITFNLQRGISGNLNDVVAIYIDTGVGGYADTAGFTATGNADVNGISGYTGSTRSVMLFTNGFRPSYAVAIQPTYMDLWSLSPPSGFSFIAGAGQGGAGSANFTLTVNCSALGLATNTPQSFKLFGTLLNAGNSYRSTEAVAGNDTSSSAGALTFTNTGYGVYNFAATAVATYPVTFSVDMSVQLTNAANPFNPGNGDTVYCGGSFQPTPFSFGSFQLTNNPTGLNTNIYSGTYLDANPTNTVEQFKFQFHSVANNNYVYDDDLNRAFTLQSGGQTLPYAYFNEVFPVPSATTNYETLSIDMGPEIYAGHFDPTTMQIEALGTLTSPKWTAGFILTNNPTSTNVNIYYGTTADGNYPGSFEQFKFVIVTTATSAMTYENGDNRTFYTLTNSGALPLAYFNGLSTYATTPVTFSVDMTVPLLLQSFNPANGDTVGCTGTFLTNQWTVGPTGFVLTNNPTALNTNIYSGTYIDRNLPSTYESYKFCINTNGGAGGLISLLESPASTGGGNRSFFLAPAGVTNALVFWNDLNTNQVVLADTTITFMVSMTNAVDIYGNAFDPANDLVFINGTFASPEWNIYTDGSLPSFWTDPFINSDYSTFVLQNNPPGSGVYSNSYVIPAGHSRYISYKYGIRNSDMFNTNVDNEALPNFDHHRYVRSVGSYTFPLDIFGIQRGNDALATEPLFGNLTMGTLSGGTFAINWLGITGVHLQTTTNLTGAWQDLNGTDGTSATNWPATGPSRYFRLVEP